MNRPTITTMTNSNNTEEEQKSKHLIPELKESEWELEYVEVSTSDKPVKMAYGWLVESYWFTHSDRDLQLICNVEDYEDKDKKYYVSLEEEDEETSIINFANRFEWWTGIREILSEA